MRGKHTILRLLLTLAIVIGSIASFPFVSEATITQPTQFDGASIPPSVSYQTHVQDIGWQDYVSNGATSGTSAQSKRLEAIRIKIGGVSGGIEYRTHVQDIGWQGWVANDALSGTSGQSKRLEAIQIRLTGEAANVYDVYYRVHAQDTGWMGWAKNGDSAGTAGYSYRLEAIEVKLVSKGGAAPGSTTRPFMDLYAPRVSYKTHVQDIGWQAYVSNGEISGTSGQSKRLEGIQIKLENIAGGIEYSTHVQDIGWQGFVANDAMSGTSGQSKRLESIKIRLTGAAASAYDVYYCVHVQNVGWVNWSKNGEASGTEGLGYRLEAIKIVLVSKGGPAPGPTALTGTLKIWSFTSELQTHAIAFKKYNPDVEVVYTQIPMDEGEYQNKVIAAATTDECPDIVGLEASFVREWVESDLLANLNDLLPIAQNLQTYQSTIDVGTFDGECRAFSYQSTPGAVFYRRSLAKEYFGTDDPEEIQALMYSDGKSFDKFTEMAAVVKEKSGGNTFMVSSIGDFKNLFFANRTNPWVVDGKFVIDPMIDQLFDIAKTFRSNGYESMATQWTEGWFAGMNDTLASADGTKQQVFCYFLPTWGLPYVLSTNGVDTAGDWGVVSGPMAYQWGGTWVGAMKNAPELDLAKEFVKFVALNEEHLTNWATGVYTNEYLLAIDPNCGELKQAAGDFVSSKLVVDKITASFDDSEMSKYLGGQNFYGGFAAAAPNVSAKLMQSSDDDIQRQLIQPLADYAEGIMTKEEAIQSFKDLVASLFPDITFD